MARQTVRPTILLVSDIHLSPAAKATAERFLAFLAGPARDATRLVILGDLFEAWAGDDDLNDPFNARVVAGLRALHEHGVSVELLVGNRDFLIGAAFAEASKVRLLADPAVCEIADKRAVLTHGDLLCQEDHDYLRFRDEARSPQWREGFLARPLAERKRLIAELRAASEAEKQRKASAIMDVTPSHVCALCAAHQATILIHGHTHRPGRHRHQCGGQAVTRWVLGEWHAQQGCALLVDAEGIRWLTPPP